MACSGDRTVAFVSELIAMDNRLSRGYGDEHPYISSANPQSRRQIAWGAEPGERPFQLAATPDAISRRRREVLWVQIALTDRSAATVVAIELLFKGFAGAGFEP
jgi:hypothetical protein